MHVSQSETCEPALVHHYEQSDASTVGVEELLTALQSARPSRLSTAISMNELHDVYCMLALKS